ncbi:MAG TPA: kynureninase [Sediminibacterium sp.]|uniref:kynureninase n=1 Tax=Sediminibacterium sp. TaxID=1917865 RepID=UPI0008B5B8D9|nr:kynureninase [Sediminibacterium sp.]MBT9483203.1 kynureninase [Sediminibacterium sp.]OHC85323.1 MAG: kynureninase [Sphingobacteriia bacterium RIFOXYC2_FULL_35_18]OHC89439.1 MAG: kynureninase [Sphingobacteriia bacterium RIFOXYD2_FULL_35_12]HLD53614.1 kynureninase [Sediminibacterium sp.]
MLPHFEASLDFAQQLDKLDPLSDFKNQFHFPQHKGQSAIYFCGNSLGLQPKSVATAVETELTTWKELAVGGYFNGPNPWLHYQEYLKPSLAKLVGAKEIEVSAMNALTVNLHLLMLSFYRPTKDRFKIIMEAGAFPSDQYAVETLVKHFGLNPSEAIIEIAPLEGKKTLSTDQIVNTIEELGDTLSMVLFGGINYYTGQFFDLKAITHATHKVGAIAGFDLAHVTGNIPLSLHEWEVDFAAWCSYKYLNAGPGAVGGFFIHEKHAVNPTIPRLAGWWGNDEKERFKMEKGFIPKTNASGWNISTAQVFNMVGLKASLSIIELADINRIREKSIVLTAYLAFLLNQLDRISFEIITPEDKDQRGAQLSLYFKERAKEIHQKLIDNGVIVDYREPGVIRVAPAPLYCSFEDVFKFYEILKTNF